MFSNFIKTFALSIAILALYAPMNESKAIFQIICEYRCEFELDTNLGTCTLGSVICRASTEAIAAANTLACAGSAAAIAFCLAGIASRRAMGIQSCKDSENRCEQSALRRYQNCRFLCTFGDIYNPR